MFSKIKDKLKKAFEKSEEVIEDSSENEDSNLLAKEKELDNSNMQDEVFKDLKTDEKETEVLSEVEIFNEEIPEEEEAEKKKKGFFGRIFGAGNKEEEELEEAEKIQEEMLEGVDEEEKDRIKKGEELENIEERREELEESIELEEVSEKEELIEIEEKDQSFLTKTFGKLTSKKISKEDFEKIWINLELFLLEINIAYEIVQKIEEKLEEKLIGNSFSRFSLRDSIKEVMSAEIHEVLKNREADLLEKISSIKDETGPIPILLLGVNGTGKTTTVAKLVKYLNDNNYSVVVAAADTFRAAALEQLEEHSKKLGFKLIKHKDGSDPAAVAFDAIEHARAKKIDIVLIDTAGRMPNNSNLMMELQKVAKVSKAKLAIFIGDSVSGNDLIDQIELFDKGVDISGVILTKVDTDNRPGSVVTTAYTIEKPIYFLGIGQKYEDLAKFDAKTIAEKLFSDEE